MGERIIELPAGIETVITAKAIKVKGPKGEVERLYPEKQLKLEKQGNQIKISSPIATFKGKALVGTFEAHIKNMIKGVQEVYTYKMKICSVHFPINVKVSGQELTVSNFIGEKTPKKVKLDPNAKVEVDGEIITITSPDKELAGQIAGRIEKSTHLSNKDRRIFQDGIYLIEKAGVKV